MPVTRIRRWNIFGTPGYIVAVCVFLIIIVVYQNDSLRQHVDKLRGIRNLASNGINQELTESERIVSGFWYHLRALLLDINHKNVTKAVQMILQKADTVQRKLKTAFDKEINLSEWRANYTIALGELVQRRIKHLQNPKDCKSAQKLLCNLKQQRGFGSYLNHVAYCLIVAYATQRTLILESQNWRYAKTGWETYFLPLSETCKTRYGEKADSWGSHILTKSKVVFLPELLNMQWKDRPDFIPLAIPEDLAPRLQWLHGYPPAWWIGQFIKYATRPIPQLQEDIENTTLSLGFQHPIVGVHVRRSDKLNREAKFHGLEEYMKHVEEYYNNITTTRAVDKRRVYLASDEPNLLKEAREKYKNYTFISDNELSKLAILNTRYTQNALRGIILDLYFLSRSDFLVCTLSSNIGRVAYSVMQTLHGDASMLVKSVDRDFFFHSQTSYKFVKFPTYTEIPNSSCLFNCIGMHKSNS